MYTLSVAQLLYTVFGRLRVKQQTSVYCKICFPHSCGLKNLPHMPHTWGSIKKSRKALFYWNNSTQERSKIVFLDCINAGQSPPLRAYFLPQWSVSQPPQTHFVLFACRRCGNQTHIQNLPPQPRITMRCGSKNFAAGQPYVLRWR